MQRQTPTFKRLFAANAHTCLPLSLYWSTMFCTVLTLAGCASRTYRVIESASVTGIERGITLDELQHMYAKRTRHEFTVAVGGEEHVCVSCAVERPAIRFYFVFQDGRLRSVVEPPRFQWETVTRDDESSYGARKPGLTKERVATVLASGDLSESELRESVTKRWPKRRKREFPNNLWPLDCITAPARLIGLPATLSAGERQRKRMRYYDPFKTVIGMTVGQVDELYGGPARVHALNGRVLRVYGELRYPPSWVGVEFVDEHVTGVFSNDFFDRIWIVER